MSSQHTFTVSNDTGDSVSITGATTSPDVGVFSVDTEFDLPHVLADGESMGVYVTASSESEGVFDSSLVVSHSGSGGDLSAPLSVTFIASPEPNLDIAIEFFISGAWVTADYDTTSDLGSSPDTVDSVDIPARIRNTGNTGAICNLAFTGTNFSCSQSDGPFYLGDAGVLTFTITFTNPNIGTPDFYNDGTLSVDASYAPLSINRLTYLGYTTTA